MCKNYRKEVQNKQYEINLKVLNKQIIEFYQNTKKDILSGEQSTIKLQDRYEIKPDYFGDDNEIPVGHSPASSVINSAIAQSPALSQI